MPNRFSRKLNLLLLFLLIVDLLYSFMQHYQSTLDGDMALIILPSPPWAQVLRDPVAWQAIFNEQVYAGTNRFIPHWTMERFYKTVPLLLQQFVSPINSVYMAGAIAKTGIQAALIYLMSVYVTGTYRVLERKFLMAAIIIAPLFQTFGANNEIGIIDASITYSFFYALGSVWLLAFFLPFFLFYVHGKRPPAALWVTMVMIPAAWAVSFNGPLNAPVILLICPLIVLGIAFRAAKAGAKYRAQWKATLANTPRLLIGGIVAGFAFAALSFYAGKYNVENVIQPAMSLKDRYMRLPRGIAEFFTAKPMLILMAALVFNLCAINLMKLASARNINRLTLWFLLFSVVFILLLPLGGYREYRPYIIRKDSVQPIIIGVFILYAMTALQIFGGLRSARKMIYGGALVMLGILFTVKDQLQRDHNDCERSALQTIASASEDIVLIKDACSIMAWQKITDPQESRFNAQLLSYWRVFPKARYYYQE